MKSNKFIFSALLVLGFGISGMNAANGSVTKDGPALAEKTIQLKLAAAKLSLTEQKIQVLFTTGENGDINFVLVKTDNRELKNEIEKQFRSMNFPFLKKESVNSVTLHFKKI